MFEEATRITVKDTMQWLARTSRIEETLYKARKISASSSALEVALLLSSIFDPVLYKHCRKFGNLHAICEQAFECAFICRTSTSKYSWEQLKEPTNELPGETIVINTLSGKSSPYTFTFSVFGEVIKLYGGGSGTEHSGEQKALIRPAEVVLI